MMENKRNWILTLALCAVLLVGNLWQNRRITQLREQLANDQNSIMDNVNDLSGQVRALSSRLGALSSRLEEGEKLVRDWELAPVGMDSKSGLLTEISLTLKEWRADTEVRLTARQDSGTYIIALKSDGAGWFSGSLPVSLAGEELFMEVQIVSDGTSRREELGSWDDVSMLLPVRFAGDSYNVPTYKNGVFSMDEYILDLADKDHKPVAVREPVFCVKLNGETVREAEALSLEEAREAAGLLEQEVQDMGLSRESGRYVLKDLEFACQPGNSVALVFTCRDEYGLKYTFPLETWEIDPGQMRDSHVGASTYDSAYSPILSWD